MTTVADLLSRLTAAGIDLRAEGDRLVCHGPRRALTGDVQTELARRKPEILAYLRSADRRSSAGAAGPPRDAPLSYSQQRLWFLDQMLPGGAAYTLPIAQRLVGPLDLEALRRSFTELVRRHEILRTTFAAVDGAPVQRVGPPFDVELPVIDLGHVPERRQAVEVERLASAELARPFDLSRDRLLRTSLITLAPDAHVLIVTLHHIVGDGWSGGVLLGEVSALYGAFVAGRPSPLPALSLQYADHAEAQRASLEGPRLASRLDHWTRRLAGIPLTLDLPGDHPRPVVQSFRGGRERFDLGSALTGGLRALGRRARTTLFMTLASGLAVLLSRASRQERFVIGTPIANRDREATESLIGCFVNTLVLPIDLAGDPPFVELLARVRETALDAYEHQDLPFERLVEEVHPHRDLSRNPLVQVSFALHNAPGQTPLPRLPLAGLEVTPLDPDPGTARLDLEVDMWEVGDSLHGQIVFNADIFDAATVARMTAHYRTLLAGIVADPQRRVATLPLLSQDERWRQLRAWNPAPATPRLDASLAGRFSERARRAPDAVALVSGDESLTGRELSRRAARLARRLRALDVGPDVPVGMCVERGAEAVIAILGILEAGGAFVPLDPEHPAGRVNFVLDDCRAPVLVTESRFRERFAGRRARLVLVDDEGPVSEDLVDEGARHRPEPDALAYVMYTSGSTGTPKGVQVAHRSVIGLLDAVNDHVRLTDGDVFLAVTTLAFDIAVLEIFLPLITGARLVLARRDEVIDGVALAAAMKRHGITAMQATPATWWTLVESGWRGDERLKALTGGEALPPKLATALVGRCGALWNLYGPTETTIWSSVDEVHDAERITIGRPLANTEMYVLDDRLEPVPLGMPGEIWLAGEGVARGYLGRPELTAERFLPHPFVDRAGPFSDRAGPFSDRPGARMYRTGDLGRRSADGRIECLGRVDHQVKLRGVRIELGEIEAALLQHQGVRDVVVVLRGEGLEDQRLVGYVVPASRPAPTAEGLREHLQDRLPAALVPAELVVLDALPATLNGKIDRAALPAPKREGTAGVSAPPASRVERTLAAIWREVLKVEGVGTRENFFDLGGHSLLLVRVRAKIAERLSADVSVIDLFRHPTIRSLAEHLAGTTGTGVPAHAAVPEGRAAAPGEDTELRARRQVVAVSRLGQAVQEGRTRGPAQEGRTRGD